MAVIMRRFIKNAKGAVTVFITLLLIPAILVSGTAVDLARIHTARSVLQDANQLAANSVLTQYDKLLHDLYGLFGVAKDDPILAELLDEYIKVSVFGESTQDRSLGTLQVLYGSNLSLEDPKPGPGMNLENEEVLRRQIEEYMKFRGPVIIVKEVIEALGSNKIKEDTEVVADKAAIDEAIGELYDKYKQLYDAIVAADKCLLPVGGISGGHFGTVSSHLKLIRQQFIDLKICYKDWEDVEMPEAPEDEANPAKWAKEEYERIRSDYAAKYNAILINIRSYAIGGKKGSNWRDGEWRSNGNVSGLDSHIEEAKKKADEFKPKFDAVVNIAREIDAMHDELERKINELERKLNSGECSDELKEGLTEKQGDPPMSIMERYRDILKWKNITAMGTAFRNGGYDYIDKTFKPMLDSLEYRNSNNQSSARLSLSELQNLTSNSSLALSDRVSAANSRAAVFAGFPENTVTYSMPPGFLKFADHPGDNKPFFDELEKMMNQAQLPPVKLYDGQKDEDGEDAEKKQKGLINAVLEMIQSAYIGLTNNPLGAKYIKDSETSEPEKPGIMEILTMLKEALSSGVIGVISDPVGSMLGIVDYTLLLTYCTSMFSNYTTTRPESIGKSKENLSEIKFPDSITGVPISPTVNYFFQSEWEYIYHGKQDAGANLSSITKLLFLVRMVCNYIRVFNVKEISNIVQGIRSAFGWCPALGIVLGELARAAFVAAESLIDIARLRSGHKVPLLKNVSQGEWICSPKGIVNAVKNTVSSSSSEKSETKDEKGLTYSNYMLFFFIAKRLGNSNAANEMAQRAGDLIEWNVINYSKHVNANEEKMAQALEEEGRFKLADMITGYEITTTTDLRMLFLSLQFAQKGVRGSRPPATLTISATDYRGY